LTLDTGVIVKGEADGWGKTIGSFTGSGTITAGTSNTSTIRNGIETADEARTATITGNPIKGNQSIPLAKSTVTLTFGNETIKTAIEAGTDLSGWITNLPGGLYAETESRIEANTPAVIFAITGTPTGPASGTVAIAIPAEYLTSGIIFTKDSNINFTILGVPSATTSGRSITGKAGKPITTNNTIEITLSNATLTGFTNNSSVAGWFSALPSGLSATATSVVNAGTTTITITVGATNNAAVTSGAVPQTIAIPANVLSSGAELTVSGSVTITINPAPVATVATATTITATSTGVTTGTDDTIEIALTNATLTGFTDGDNVKTWFSTLPAGLDATATSSVSSGTTTITITVTGTPTEDSSATFTITIPAASLSSDEDLVVGGQTLTFAVAS
jgi:hypothetical protein